MKLRFLISGLLLFAVYGWAQAQNAVVKTTAKGARYQIINAHPGDRIKLNDVITFNLAIKTERDSLLMSSYQRGKPFTAQVQPPQTIDDLMDIFPQLALNDSVRVIIPSDSLFKNREQDRPPFLAKNASVIYTLKIERIQSLDEAIAEKKAAEAKIKASLDELKAQEPARIAKYVASLHPAVKAVPSGLYYQIITPSAKPKPLPGDTLLVNYIGRTLDGKVFDANLQEEAQKAGVLQPGRPYEPFQFVVKNGDVIPGWDEGFLLLNQGSKARLIIPSKLAYGPNQSGPDIAPYSPLVFDVELLSIKAGKHPSVIKKTPVKKASGKKPVKKPVSAKKK
ncbi:FKBP-type peptidyl-prolyl cis-trans isomerase [Mucilaginibacter arboris]|uniref:peptidylprolyl isomerase n=1 Tax=Mucilaginibacter arboris TaxID=2682090 RepID=A0A7K1SVZ5_9SPHI|nr:FKBP-type peptidyl-prolyl cis-trans isomerase [Mucilaginibacter arboris]MVN21496.1 peptidylprolyl isomerase [Mucilaginibacter arboris]